MERITSFHMKICVHALMPVAQNVGWPVVYNNRLYTKIGDEYALSADLDDRWRPGGTLEEIQL